jgi:hypothetical protein
MYNRKKLITKNMKNFSIPILLFALYIAIYYTILFIRFTYNNFNIYISVAVDLIAISLIVFLIDKLIKIIDKKDPHDKNLPQ